MKRGTSNLIITLQETCQQYNIDSGMVIPYTEQSISWYGFEETIKIQYRANTLTASLNDMLTGLLNAYSYAEGAMAWTVHSRC